MPESAEAAALSAATRDVLETMFFTEVFVESAGNGPVPGDGLDVRLHFQGQRSGDFRIAIGPGPARTIAANFLGAEDEAAIAESQVSDVACELANMICGSALSRLAADVAFDLSHPEVTPARGDDSGWPEGAARTFDLENGSLSAAIQFD